MSKRKKILLIPLLLLIFFCAFIFWGKEIYLQLAWINTRRGIPDVEPRYNQIWSELLAISNAPLLQEEKSGLDVSDEFHSSNCIRGGGGLTYGTQKSFEEVVAEYSAAFEEMGWSYAMNNNARLNAWNHTTTAHLTVVNETRLKSILAEWEQYPTIYRISISYGEPQITDCWG